jgi:hypothetical protein
VHDRARKLEQIKDLYLTAEAIGEANVDKHFDQLLAQQRELISDYFRQPGPAGSAGGAQPVGQAGSADQPETGLRARRDPGPPSAGQRRPPPAGSPTGHSPTGRFPAGRRPRPRASASRPTTLAHGDGGRADAGHRGARPR